MKPWSLMLVASAAAATSQPAIAQPDIAKRVEQHQTNEKRKTEWHLYLASGFGYYSSEDEGSRTDHYRVPMIARLSAGRLRLSASMPYLMVSGPGGSLIDGEETDNPDPTVRDSRKGFGDLNLQARYAVVEDVAGFDLDVVGRVKLGTASHRKGFGTGKTDYIAGAELSRDLGNIEPFVEAEYRFNGDRRDEDYRNTVSASVGSDFVLGKRTRASLSYDFSQSRFSGRSGFHSVGGRVSRRLKDTLTLTGTADVGLTGRAPDLRVGALLSARVF